jgi:hypothetical protein
MTNPSRYRADLPPIPARMLMLPVERRLPVPWFVGLVDDHYDFRLMGEGKLAQAIKERRGWVFRMGIRAATSGLRLTPALGRSVCLPGPVLPPGAPGSVVPSGRSVGTRRLSRSDVPSRGMAAREGVRVAGHAFGVRTPARRLGARTW